MSKFKERLERERRAVKTETKTTYEKAMDALKALPEWNEFQAAVESEELREALVALMDYGELYKSSKLTNELGAFTKSESYMLLLSNEKHLWFGFSISSKGHRSITRIHWEANFSPISSIKDEVDDLNSLINSIVEQIARRFPGSDDGRVTIEANRLDSMKEVAERRGMKKVTRGDLYI